MGRMIWGSDFGRGKRFFPSEMSRPALGHSIGTKVLSGGRGQGEVAGACLCCKGRDNFNLPFLVSEHHSGTFYVIHTMHVLIIIILANKCTLQYRVIHKSLRDFRPLQYSGRDGHAKEQHVNRGKDTASFCPTLQVLDMSTLLCLSWLLHSHVQKFRRDL